MSGLHDLGISAGNMQRTNTNAISIGNGNGQAVAHAKKSAYTETASDSAAQNISLAG